MSSWEHQSIVEITEPDLVHKLVHNDHWRSRIINIHGMPDHPSCYLEEPLDQFGPNVSGDVDLLLVDKLNIRESTAIQIKRIKVSENAFHTGMPNKLGDVQKGARQANLLAELGFYQVYLYLFIVVDSRIRNIGQYSYEGLTPQLRSTLRAEITTSALLRRVGMIEFEFTQPMDSPPLGVGTYGGSLVRLAEPHSQAPEVTGWVNCVIERNS